MDSRELKQLVGTSFDQNSHITELIERFEKQNEVYKRAIGKTQSRHALSSSTTSSAKLVNIDVFASTH